MSSPQENKNKSRGGRNARIKLRKTPGEMPNPCPPGQRGGHYKPLDDAGLKQIMDTAYQILADIGMGEMYRNVFRISPFQKVLFLMTKAVFVILVIWLKMS